MIILDKITDKLIDKFNQVLHSKRGCPNNILYLNREEDKIIEIIKNKIKGVEWSAYFNDYNDEIYVYNERIDVVSYCIRHDLKKVFNYIIKESCEDFLLYSHHYIIESILKKDKYYLNEILKNNAYNIEKEAFLKLCHDKNLNAGHFILIEDKIFNNKKYKKKI